MICVRSFVAILSSNAFKMPAYPSELRSLFTAFLRAIREMIAFSEWKSCIEHATRYSCLAISRIFSRAFFRKSIFHHQFGRSLADELFNSALSRLNFLLKQIDVFHGFPTFLLIVKAWSRLALLSFSRVSQLLYHAKKTIAKNAKNVNCQNGQSSSSR